MLFIEFIQQFDLALVFPFRPFVEERRRACAGIVVIQLHQVGIDGAQFLQCVRHVFLICKDHVHVVIPQPALLISPVNHLIVGALHFPQVAKRRKRNGADLERALFAQCYDGNGLNVILFRKRVFQRSSAVTDPFCSHILRPVQVTQSNVVKSVENDPIHVIRAADGEFLRLGTASSRYELMADQHVAFFKVRMHAFDRRSQRIRIRLDLCSFFRQKCSHVDRFNKGKQPEMHRPESICQGHAGNGPIVDR